MTFFSILCALLIEQLQPLRSENPIYRAVKSFATRVEAWCNAGEQKNGRLGWWLIVLTLTVPTALIYWVCLYKLNIFAALIWNILIVYLTLGFRHYSHYFTSIQLALHSGDEDTARSLLAEWTKTDTTGLYASEISRLAVEKALITTHRSVFGVFFWFLMPAGPAFAVMYRVAEYLARIWNEPQNMKNEVFGQHAAHMFYILDWIPSRLTAIAFAIVGNFEDAIYAWRNFAHRWKNESEGIILASGGGALGVWLGGAQENAIELPTDALVVDSVANQSDVMPGEPASIRFLQSTVGLVWRALLLWILLLLLLSMTAWLA
ncbi:MAG: Adenosylcobinamide-phosphate synthase [Solimicrobium sp.]|jgi:adenosylcobinamide-phosphate synthase|nr:Adenosylcobinamide-phosphate synthase [Solimicrobium sp.]